jgi:hypothetical protein
MSTNEHETFGIRHPTVVPENFDPGTDTDRDDK